MVKLKGLYEWKLTNADTGEVVREGQQWNIVSDKMIEFLFVGVPGNASPYGGYSNGLAIQLSDTIPTPGVDYRIAGASNSFNRLATGSVINNSADFFNFSKVCTHNFSPPGSPLTIRVIGVKIFAYGADSFFQPNFVSFIELSTPITQNTNQYLYVKYTLYFSYLNGRGYNTPNNRYIMYGFNNSIFSDVMLNLGGIYTQFGAFVKYHVTSYLPPSNINNMLRAVNARYATAYTDRANNFGNTYGMTISKDFAVGDIPGPIGTILSQIQNNSAMSTPTYYSYFHAALGYSPSSNIVSSVSRVFVHPQGRESAYFSDPTYPASSQGTVLISGTPTNKFTIVGRIRITKTGDASDLVDEVVNYSSVNADADTITVTQNIDTGDKYRLTTTGSLPLPLVVGVDYYVININSTTIKLATSYANSFAGIAIDITSSGTGDHTLSRQNTGQYKLELEPWSTDQLYLTQLPMGIDYDGYVMPQNLSSTTNYPTNYAEGDYIANGNSVYNNELFLDYTSYMIRGAVKKGNYVYTVQQSRKGLINNVCRWLFNSVETSIPLCKFGTGSTKVVIPLDAGTKMYIFTNEGVYEYTYATPTVAPVLLSIAGLIDTNILDACLDPITGYFWTGHTTGLSRINMGTLTATKYLMGTGQALEGMSANEVHTAGGQLDAYNGRILRGGYDYYNTNYGSTGRNSAWVLVDGVGYYRVNGTATCTSCCLRKGTNQVVWTDGGYIRIYEVTVTGVNVGSSVQYSTYSTSGNITAITHPLSGFVQVNSDTFLVLYTNSYTGNVVRGLFKANNTYSYDSLPLGVSSSTVYAFSGGAYATGALKRCKIDLDENGTFGFMYFIYLILPILGTTSSYGWDGSSWVKDNTNSRNIPKTATHVLVSDLSVDFNNATGGAWDQQFISGEHFTFVYGPTIIKDNLQTIRIKTRQYVCETVVVENYSVTVPSTFPYDVIIPEVSNPNFRDMDVTDFITFVYEGSTRYTDYTGTVWSCSLPGSSYISLGNNVPTGTPIKFYTTGSNMSDMSYPLTADKIYYAININTTTIRVADSYANAIGGIYLSLPTDGSAKTNRTYVVSLSSTYYKADSRGIFKFSSADAGKNLTLTYTYSKFTV